MKTRFHYMGFCLSVNREALLLGRTSLKYLHYRRDFDQPRATNEMGIQCACQGKPPDVPDVVPGELWCSLSREAVIEDDAGVIGV
jgi:hypothetical protein